MTHADESGSKVGHGRAQAVALVALRTLRSFLRPRSDLLARGVAEVGDADAGQLAQRP